MNQPHSIINSALALAANAYRAATAPIYSTVNLSVYLRGTQDGHSGLIKMEKLYYRADPNMPARAARVFYPLSDGNAVIVDAVRAGAPVLRSVTPDSIQAHGANSRLAWVYAHPLSCASENIYGVICASGSNADHMNNSTEHHILEGIIINLANVLGVISTEYDIPKIWSDKLTL